MCHVHNIVKNIFHNYYSYLMSVCDNIITLVVVWCNFLNKSDKKLVLGKTSERVRFFLLFFLIQLAFIIFFTP